MELTFLKIVQRTLSAIDSQNVSSAGDSTESEQVGIIVNRVYEEIISHRDWPFLRKQGVSLVTNTSGVAWELEFPSDLLTLEYVKYNSKNVTYLDPKSFIDLLQSRDTTADEVNSSGVYTDRDPVYWTSYDENSMVFDGYDSDDSTLLPSLCYVQYIREITSELSGDSDIPEIPVNFHHVLLDGVLARAFNELAQDTTKSQIQEVQYRRGLARMNRWARKVEDALPNSKGKYNFGRTKWK